MFGLFKPKFDNFSKSTVSIRKEKLIVTQRSKVVKSTKLDTISEIYFEGSNGGMYDDGHIFVFVNHKGRGLSVLDRWEGSQEVLSRILNNIYSESSEARNRAERIIARDSPESTLIWKKTSL